MITIEPLSNIDLFDSLPATNGQTPKIPVPNGVSTCSQKTPCRCQFPEQKSQTVKR
jgi:hypothetical protein